MNDRFNTICKNCGTMSSNNFLCNGLSETLGLYDGMKNTSDDMKNNYTSINPTKNLENFVRLDEYMSRNKEYDVYSEKPDRIMYSPPRSKNCDYFCSCHQSSKDSLDNSTQTSPSIRSNCQSSDLLNSRSLHHQQNHIPVSPKNPHTSRNGQSCKCHFG